MEFCSCTALLGVVGQSRNPNLRVAKPGVYGEHLDIQDAQMSHYAVARLQPQRILNTQPLRQQDGFQGLHTFSFLSSAARGSAHVESPFAVL